jgi:hypothetical protein
MFLTIFLIAAAAILYLNVGFFIGHLHWVVLFARFDDAEHVFRENYCHVKHPKLQELLWPITAGKSGEHAGDDAALIHTFNKESDYNAVMAIVWPMKMIYLLVVWIVLSFQYCMRRGVPMATYYVLLILIKICSALIRFITVPTKKILRVDN